jgi:acetyltransferase-like isoleucine patch superfamily enzyme
MCIIHPLASVQSNNIGENTMIWQYAIILNGAKIGKNCNINCHTFIENDVIIGDEVTIKAGVYLWDGVRLGNKVFIVPNVSFTNDKYPRSKQYPSQFQITSIEEGVSIGAAAIIMGGITIGAYAIIAAGALVNKSVPGRALMMGSPAIIKGWMNEDGTKMRQTGDNTFEDKYGNTWFFKNNQLVPA